MDNTNIPLSFHKSNNYRAWQVVGKQIMLKKFRKKTSDIHIEQSSSQADESRQDSRDFFGESSDTLGEMQDTDIRNSELVIDAHHEDPFEVMRIQTYDDLPMTREKVGQVYLSTCHSIMLYDIPF